MSDVIAALLPPAVTLVMFVVALRAIVGADRRERRARARIEDELAARSTSSDGGRTPDGEAPDTGAREEKGRPLGG